MSRVRTQGAELAVGVRRGSRTAPGRAKGLEENGAGPSGGGGGERGIFKHRGQGQAHKLHSCVMGRPEANIGSPTCNITCSCIIIDNVHVLYRFQHRPMIYGGQYCIQKSPVPW